MTPIVPPIPATPTAASTPVEWDVYLRAVDIHNRAAHAAAQQATADAMQGMIAAQNAATAALNAPMPQRLPTRAELVFAILRDHPQATILTNGQLVTGCKNIVDAYVATYPAAVSG